MKNLIIVTGGAGFVGSNLIKSLLKKTNKKIISLDNYSSGNKKNHIKDSRVKYLQYITIGYKDMPGNYCESVIPDPIPNSEVKPFSANGTLS